MKWIFTCCLLACMGALAQETDNSMSNIAGNPYLFKDWANGVVKFSSGRVLTQFKLKFDCVQNELLLQFQGSAFSAPGKIDEFIIYTKSGRKKDSMVFRSGYPRVGKANENTYYQVLFQDRVTLLRLFNKNIMEQKDLIGSKVNRRLVDEELYYLLQDKTMILLPADRNTLPQSLPDKADQLTQFIKDQQLKMNDAGDFIQIARWYNDQLKS